MTPTITDYRPGIYLLMARRAAARATARARREQRLIRIADALEVVANFVLLLVLAFGSGWLLLRLILG